MFLKEPLKTFLYYAVNIFISLSLIYVFFSYTRQTIKTIPLARASGFTRIKPDPMNYFWKINIENTPIDKNLVRYYTDYYDQLLIVLPTESDIEGILGYCYYQLGDKKKAEIFLKTAITKNPYYFWYYYNLAIINLHNNHYPEAIDLLQKSLQIDPNKTLNVIGASQLIYLPLIESNKKELSKIPQHLIFGYKQSSLLLQNLKDSLQKEKVEDFIKSSNLEIYAF